MMSKDVHPDRTFVPAGWAFFAFRGGFSADHAVERLEPTEAHKERVRNYEAGGTGTYPIRVRHFGGHFPGGAAHDR